jgi:phosphatidylglycerol:prolipoprotein diacylglycerol transferase
MYPRIAAALSRFFGVGVFQRLEPNPAVIYAAAMMVLLLLFVRRCARAELSREHALGMAVWAMVGGLIGARVFFLVQHLPDTLAAPAQVFDVSGGTASWGAYLGGMLGLVLYARAHGLAVLPYADVVASELGLGIAIGRWSCFLNGDDYGTISTLPWAVRFPHASIPFFGQVRAGDLDPMAGLSLPVHPVQLYLSANGLALFAFGTWLWRREGARPGFTFWAYVVAYCGTRFLWEHFRGDQERLLGGTLTVPQLMSVIVVGPAAWGLWRALRTPTPRLAPVVNR